MLKKNQWRTLFTRAFHAGEITDTVESIKCFSNFRFSILIVIYNCILKYVDFLFDSIEHQKLDIQWRRLGLFSSEAIHRAQRGEKMLGGSGN